MSLDVFLDDRRVAVSRAIIKTYLEAGEPMGSRTISKYSDLKLSSATVRNEMSNLEEMEYIVQSHTSARRVPSDKGYRFYVDQIVLDKEGKVIEFKEMMARKVDKLELVLKRMVQVLAANTSYVIMISSPNYHKVKPEFIQLSKMEKHKPLAVVIVEGNIIKNTIIDIEDNLSDEGLLNLNILLNSGLNGLIIENINSDVINKLKGDAGIHSRVADLILNGVAEAIKAGEEDLQIYASGATNIFRYPELSDGDETSRFTDILEHKEVLQEFAAKVNSGTEEEAGIRVYIGDESPVQFMEDCSVVTANYDLREDFRGATNIIGPKRMDYEKVLGTLRNLMNQLDTMLKKDER